MDTLKEAIEILARENGINGKDIPVTFDAFRALMNITDPRNLNEEYFRLQDGILKEELKKKKVTDVLTLPFDHGVALYQGDITLLKADSIVNACNPSLLGCFIPLHHCIDNAIHSFAGLQVRRDLERIMERQSREEEPGKCKITEAYNLPCRYILHTVGPQVHGKVKEKDREDLRNCYRSCLDMAKEYQLVSIVFCSISTGIYGFPIEEASRIALNTIFEYKKKVGIDIRIVFDVFSKKDFDIYKKNLEEYGE